LFDRLLAELKKTQDRGERRAIHRRAGQFPRSQKIVQQALARSCLPQLTSGKRSALMLSGLANPQTPIRCPSSSQGSL